MITLKRGGRTKTMSKRSYEILGKNLDGWVKVESSLSVSYAQPQKEQKKESSSKEAATREEMIEYLKSKGVKVHWNLSDEKLKSRYETEIEIN